MFVLQVASVKHYVLYDRRHQFITTIAFRLAFKEEELKPNPNAQEKQPEQGSMKPQKAKYPSSFTEQNCTKLAFPFWMENPFSQKWQSQYFQLNMAESMNQTVDYGEVPFSLETFLQMYKDPRNHCIRLRYNPNFSYFTPEEFISKAINIGTLKLQSTFKGNPTYLPFRSTHPCPVERHIMLVTYDSMDTVLCSGTLIERLEIENMDIFQKPFKANPNGLFACLHYQVKASVEPKHIVFLKGDFEFEKQMAGTAQVIIVAPRHQGGIEPIPNLKETMEKVSNSLSLRSVTIIQNMNTDIQQAQGLVFYDSLCQLYERLMKSYLYSLVQDEWMIHGMATYKNSFYYLHDIFQQLCDSVQKGEEFSPLNNDEYSCDEVWRLKATVLYHVFANLSQQGDRLTHELLGAVKDGRKVDTNVLIKSVKNKKWKSIRRTYEKQFIKGTGIERLTYSYEYTKKNQNKIRFRIRQKSLQSVAYQFYNSTRIRLEEHFDCKSPLITKIMQKNSKPELMNARRKDNLQGPLLVPAILESQSFVKATLPVIIVQTNEQDAEDKQNNDIEILKKNETREVVSNMMGKKKAPIKKAGEKEAAAQPGWMKMDPAFTFMSVLKNGDLTDVSLLRQLTRQKTENQLFKIIKSARGKHLTDHGIVKQLMQMTTIKEQSKTSTQIKMEILDIFHLVLAQTNDRKIWDHILGLLKLYQPPCYDRSYQGFRLKVSIVECVGRIKFRPEFSSYFDEFHRILLVMSQDSEQLFSHREEVQFRRALYKSILNWNTKLAGSVVTQVWEVCKLYLLNLEPNLSIIRVIVERASMYLDLLDLDPTEFPHARKLVQVMEQCIREDKTNKLWLSKFSYRLAKAEKEQSTIKFFELIFEQIDYICLHKFNVFPESLKLIKDLLLKNKKKYALDMQIGGLSTDQNYYIAERLWGLMTSGVSLYDAKIRLLFMKIYRVLYFYFVPVCFIQKLKCLGAQTYDFAITLEERDEILETLKDFTPDRNWFTNYDTHFKKADKDHEKPQPQVRHHKSLGHMGKTAFMKKVKETKTEFTFASSNLIARYARQNQDKQINWSELSKKVIQEALKELTNKRAKPEVILELKSLRKKLRSNKRPIGYNFDSFKTEAFQVLNNASQSTDTLSKLFDQCDKVLESLVQEADRDTKLILPKHIFK